MTKLNLFLFNPDTLLPHRAGIAGLALALDTLDPKDAPIAWNTTEDTITLSWDNTTSDRDAITWLMQQTYKIEDGYIHVPALNLSGQGRYTFTQGVISTLLQHSKQRTLAKDTQNLQFSGDEGDTEITIVFRPVLDCYYTRDFNEAFTSKGQFKPAIALKGHHLPGLVECFVNGAYQESPENFLALLFLPLACSYYKLPAPGLRSALVIPEISNLTAWVRRRKKLAGITYQQFRASGAGEAGLRFLLWDRSSTDARRSGIEYCEAYQLGKQTWDGNQSYLKQEVYRIRAKPDMLDLYEQAAALFKSKVRITEKGESWLATSQILPWLSNNLIADQAWYDGFFEFHKAHSIYPDDRAGLVKMTDTLDDRDRILFNAVQGGFSTFLHEQISQAQKQGRSLDYGQVTNKVINRLKRPSTQQQFATALVEFLSRYPSKSARGQGLEIAARIHSDRNWRQARDLTLLAIATYQGKSKAESEAIDAPVDEMIDDDASEYSAS
jgi:CRISPR-associated protein Cas8a1/Csx13